MVRVAVCAAMTAGIPYSRATMLERLRGPPMSVTIALAEADSGVHAGVVVTAIKILPGWNFSKSAGLFRTQAGAVTTPVLVPMPVNTIFPSFCIYVACDTAFLFFSVNTQ